MTLSNALVHLFQDLRDVDYSFFSFCKLFSLSYEVWLVDSSSDQHNCPFSHWHRFHVWVFECQGHIAGTYHSIRYPHFADRRQALNFPSLPDRILKNEGAVNPGNTTWSPLLQALRSSYTAFVALLPSSNWSKTHMHHGRIPCGPLLSLLRSHASTRIAGTSPSPGPGRSRTSLAWGRPGSGSAPPSESSRRGPYSPRRESWTG